MKIKYSLFVVIVFLFIELFAQSVILLFGEKKYSFFIKPFSNQISKVTTDYKIFWDYKNNKMLPGRYETKEGVTYNINSKGFRGKEFKKIKEKKETKDGEPFNWRQVYKRLKDESIYPKESGMK